MSDVAFLLPDDVSPVIAVTVILISFATSTLTAAFGLGGGLTLLAAMSALLPPAAVIPVHGVAQLTSNFSRAALLRAHVKWSVLGWFGVGAVIGAMLGGRLALALPTEALRAGVAIFILITVWGPKTRFPVPGDKAFFAGGAISSFLTMFFGATGPIVASLLSATRLDRMQIVSTHAAAMVTQHGIKSLAFGVLGFAFVPWLPMIAAITIAGFAGTFFGTRILKKMPEAQFQKTFKVLLTLIALYLLGMAISGTR